MKKNLLIIAVIFILPMITYFILSSEGTKAEQKVSVPVDTPVIVKFSSPLCRDCKQKIWKQFIQNIRIKLLCKIFL